MGALGFTSCGVPRKTASSDEELAFKQKERDIALYTRKVRKLFQSMDDAWTGYMQQRWMLISEDLRSVLFFPVIFQVHIHDVIQIVVKDLRFGGIVVLFQMLPCLLASVV